MMSWYLVQLLGLKELNLSLVIPYALVHDLVELFSGDTDPYNPSVVATKADRERDARAHLIRELPDFPDMHRLIDEYERGSTPEAVFVRALDKIVPILEIALDNGRSWQERGQTIAMLKSVKSPKVEHCPVVHDLYRDIIRYLEERRDEFFPVGTQGTFAFMGEIKGVPIKPILANRRTKKH